MRAIVVGQTGGPEVLQLSDVNDPEPGPGELLVKVGAAGVNFTEIYSRIGLYPIEPPFTPGAEVAGHVLAVGEGVTDFKAGDRVASADARGSYAEQVIVPAERAVPVPDGVDIETAAAVLLQGMTAHYLTQSTYPIKAGETALVHAAAGGMGLLLIQMVKAAGAKVIGTVSSAEKAKLAAEAGADEVIRYDQLSGEELAAEVRSRNGGQGVHVVYDGVGKDTFDASLASLRVRGMLVSFGNASGPVPPVAPLRLMQGGSLFLTRPTLGSYIAARQELEWRAGDLFRWLQDGTLSVRIGATYPLGQAAQAQTDMESRKTTGKLLLVP
ncbi:quinone oxidoreductase [Catenulispora sp. NF23]|uniref:quinone oxidoreductase family protein n=1 Tax=Catenulispora pinistramenti TaxID=2705254 RepID=UPI001BAC6E69|nr:quinone oxidoreductase [Catenulispora pinistramenti]MBS2533009.1 quinone oxidoreductase [Catenulispora pinistramenti]